MTPPAALIDLLKLAAQALEARGISYAVSGGLALMAHGFVRATRGVNLLVSVPAIRLPEVIETLKGVGCEADVRQSIEDFRRNHFMALPCGDLEIEVFTPLLPYHEQALRRRVSKPVEGVPVWFLSAEDLFIVKTLFYRSKDVADLKGIAATLKGKLDGGYILRTLKGILPGDDARLAEAGKLLDLS
jgi:hypothetical protein